MPQYSTTKAIINKFRPGTFRPQLRGFGVVRGIGDSSGISLSQSMMFGMACGGVAAVLWCKHNHKIGKLGKA